MKSIKYPASSDDQQVTPLEIIAKDVDALLEAFIHSKPSCLTAIFWMAYHRASVESARALRTALICEIDGKFSFLQSEKITLTDTQKIDAVIERINTKLHNKNNIKSLGDCLETIVNHLKNCKRELHKSTINAARYTPPYSPPRSRPSDLEGIIFNFGYSHTPVARPPIVEDAYLSLPTGLN
ncbi:MAG: hypothetical protein Q7V63_02825 [Gammaproteobacteria bacterium]|nr:hypothetical protein [Gammaproteobacteria bacterium]